MRAWEIVSEITEAAGASGIRQIAGLSDRARHDLLTFIHDWLSGKFMRAKPDDTTALVQWEAIARLFPPKVPEQVRLYRVVTVPITLARQHRFTFKPAPGAVSSWSRTLVGLDAVVGVATDMVHNYGSYKDKAETARIGIEAIVPGHLVLATSATIRHAFMALSHDYFERYPETVNQHHQDGRTYVTVTHPGYPGGDDPHFTMDDVGFQRDVLNQPGGNYRQYECVLRTPPTVDATLVQVYRLGDKIVRHGHDDPHNITGRAPRVRRLTRPPGG